MKTVKEIQAEVKREESVLNQLEKRGAASSVIEAQKEAVKAAKKKLEAALNTPTEKAIQVCKDIFKVHKEQAKLLKEEIGEEKYQAFFSTIKQINTIEEFSKNLRFQIALGNELKKISPDEANQLRFDIKKIRFFKNTDIATISDIPEYLSDITYRCRLEGQKTVSIEDMISRI